MRTAEERFWPKVKAFRAERRIRAIARRERDERFELLAEFLAEDVAGPWVTPADVADATKLIDP